MTTTKTNDFNGMLTQIASQIEMLKNDDAISKKLSDIISPNNRFNDVFRTFLTTTNGNVIMTISRNNIPMATIKFHAKYDAWTDTLTTTSHEFGLETTNPTLETLEHINTVVSALNANTESCDDDGDEFI